MSDWYNKWNAEKIEEARLRAKKDCDNALKNMTHTFSDGRVVQVRPQDMSNFQAAIQMGESQRWILLDNTTRLTTVDEMQEALNSGLSQGKAIWDQYADDLESLALNATTSE